MYDDTLEYDWLGRQPYKPVWQLLSKRASAVADGLEYEKVFACEHEPVYTTGRRGVDNRLNTELLAEVVQSDRGGEMTFHGPGQIMLYPVINLRERKMGVKQYVYLLEQSCINLLHDIGVSASRRCGFPGVWTVEGKIAALGVRVTRGVAYHGMALNANVDPNWFAAINPCGLRSSVVCISDYCEPSSVSTVAESWQNHFSELLSNIK